MTSAPASFKRGKIAFTMGAILLLSATFPFATVFADNEQGPDDLVVVIEPRLGTLLGNGIAVASTGNMFVFDYSLHHADGSPYLVTEIMVDVHTVDGRADFEAAWPTLIWTENVATAPSNKGVLRIPANEIVAYLPDDADGYYHEMPFGGMSLTLLAVKDASGNSLLDANGHYPAGQHSLMANRLASQGSWEEADAADELFTPIFLFNGQLSGLTQFGNPVINPGFEVGYQSGASPDETEDTEIPAFTTAIPPWFLLSDAGNQIDSGVHIQGAAGSSGSAGTVRYNTADNDDRLMFGQLFFVPGANSPGPWYGSSSVKAEFDVRAHDEAGLISNFHGLATLHWNDSTLSDGDAQFTVGRPAGIPTDNVWRHVTLDFAGGSAGKQLNSFFFSFNLDDASAPAGSQLVVELDNVRLTGATLSPASVNPVNDLTDGYSAFMLPVGATVATNEQVAQRLTALAGGAEGYVYRLKAMDYTGIDPQVVDVKDGYTVFALLDESYIPAMSRAPEDVTYFAQSNGLNGNSFFRFVESDGSVSDDLLVVVPASLAGSRIVPWMFNDIATNDNYVSTYGGVSEPVSGYHSVARNNLMFTNLADSLDYEFTPIALDAAVGPSMASATSVLLTCPGQAVDTQCSADPNPDLNIAVSTDSLVFETLTVELVANGPVDETLFPGKVLGTGSVATPGGDVTITLSTAAMEEMASVSDMRVFARVLPGVFAEGAETDLFRLDNFLPVASFVHSSLDNLFRNSVVTFTSTSTDPDGAIASQTFEVFYVADATDDADDHPLGLFRAGNSPGLTVSIPDDGDFRVEMTVVDTGGATATASALFSAGNRAPQIVINGPAFGGADQPLLFTYSVVDVDGIVASHATWAGDDAEVPCALVACPFTATFDTPGVQQVAVVATDDDGVTTNKTFDVLIDAISPASAIVAPAAPTETAGWFTEPVDISITREDTGGSGIAFSTVTIDGLPETVGGSSAIERTLASDGVHEISVTTTDRAGNVELTAVTRTVKIDTTKPLVSLVGPVLVEGSPISGVFLTDEVVEIVANATDLQSGITKVEFFVDGGDAAGTVLLPDADGLFRFSWTAAGSGLHEIVVLATNAAGQREISDTITVLVI